MRRPALAGSLLALACNPAPAASTASDGDTSSTSSSTTTTGGAPTTTDGAPPEPVCCGCLCLDPQWSCSVETCLYEDGSAAALAPEAGFLAVPAHEFAYATGTEMTVVHAAEARHWYVFQPADEAPETRPLLVFFNGGPGFSTAILFGLNTGPYTADLHVAGPAGVAANPHSWTRFANLLYVDPRETGYSYDIAAPTDERPPAPFLPEHDAADFAQVILAFLARHPQLVDAPVILVGESYGGLRASLINQFMLYPGELADSAYTNAQLLAAIRAHEERRGGTRVAEQFAARVMIQPVIAWSEQGGHTPDAQRPLALGCVPEPDLSQCDRPFGWSTPYFDAVRAALTDPAPLAVMTGVDVATIAWMYADARVGAHPRGGGGLDEGALAAVFGALPEGESYYVSSFLRPTPAGYGFNFPRYAFPFFRTLPGVRTLITDSGKDLVVFTPDFPAVIAAHTTFIAAAAHDDSPVPGSERPGRLHVTYQPQLGLPDPSVTIRFPHYPDAGHMVTHVAGAELLADIEAWFEAP